MSGIRQWLRKHFSAEWWRSRCQCLQGDANGNAYDGHSSKPPQVTSIPFHDITGSQICGTDNPAYTSTDTTVTNGDAYKIEVPTIAIQPPPPPEYSSLENTRHTPDETYVPGYYDSQARYGQSLESGAKINSRYSITSDYVSDAESDYYHPSVSSHAAAGRYSSRNFAERKKHRRKFPHHASHSRPASSRSYTRPGHSHRPKPEMRKYRTRNLTSSESFEPRKPISRRHSIDNPNSPRDSTGQSTTKLNLSISIKARRQSIKSIKPEIASSDQNGNNAQNSLSSGARPKTHSFSQQPAIENPPEQSSSKIPAPVKKSQSLSPIPHKSTGVVRNETILEMPIYLKQTRPASAHAGSRPDAAAAHAKQRRARHQKPPRSRKDRKNGRDQSVRTPKKDQWLYGYASLPASWNAIGQDKLQQAGLTKESLLESLERLDFEKLCRPVPSIPNVRNTPRKSVVDQSMPGGDKEILKDTYKLENSDVVLTDL